ncbi:MAG TPA: hypothetical protein PLZ84_06010, partial [Clostridia bacterium]|nr:hypothetical protein [Clostridia bacterium]
GDVEEVLARFYRAPRNRFLTVEPHLTVFKGFENLRDSAHKNKFTYSSEDEAFDAAVAALKEVLEKRGFRYE